MFKDIAGHPLLFAAEMEDDLKRTNDVKKNKTIITAKFRMTLKTRQYG